MYDIYQKSRDRMVREQLIPRGIVDEAVLRAMGTVPRHLFVDGALRARAYEDCPLPLIDRNQTISQPYVVALMSQMLDAKPGMRVLEVGTGSGYQAAVLDAMGLDVHSIECVKELYFRVSKLLMDLRYRGIRLRLGDGTLGWPEAGPFDRIIVTAGGPEIPAPLMEQLADDGILIIPVGADKRTQQLALVRKTGGRIYIEKKDRVAFVDLVGRHGWQG